jgi:hypothetical protein
MKLGVTYAELLRRRGDHERAAKVEVDMNALRFEIGVGNDDFI